MMNYLQKIQMLKTNNQDFNQKTAYNHKKNVLQKTEYQQHMGQKILTKRANLLSIFYENGVLEYYCKENKLFYPYIISVHHQSIAEWNKIKKNIPIYFQDFVLMSEYYIKNNPQDHKTHKIIYELLIQIFQLRNKLLESFSPLIPFFIKKYSFIKTFQYSLQDLESEGYMGLITALESFYFLDRNSLTTYISNHIRQAIKRFIIENQKGFKIPYVSFYKKQGENQDQNSLYYFSEFDPDGVESPMQDDSIENLWKKFLMNIFNNFFLYLTPQEQIVVKLRYGLDQEKQQNLTQIAGRMNLSRERIRQIEQKALKKLYKISNLTVLTSVDLSIQE